MNSQLICTAIIHHGMQHDNPDFLPLLYKTNAAVAPVDTVLCDMGFDDENNHVGARKIGTAAIIPTRYADVPIHRTSGTHRKEMKRNFPRQLYSQRNKSETIFFVVKRMMPGDITSRNDTTQDNEILFRLIAYNSYRVTKLESVVLAWFLQGRFIKKSQMPNGVPLHRNYQNLPKQDVRDVMTGRQSTGFCLR